MADSRSTRCMLLDLGAERVDDARERDLPEIDLFLEDQVQQEVERALEHRRRDLVGHGRQGIQPGRAVEASLTHLSTAGNRRDQGKCPGACLSGR